MAEPSPRRPSSDPDLLFLRVPESKQAKNRVHVDLIDPDASAVEKLVGLGAAVVREDQIPGHSWTVMQDPECNEFCIASKAFAGWD